MKLPPFIGSWHRLVEELDLIPTSNPNRAGIRYSALQQRIAGRTTNHSPPESVWIKDEDGQKVEYLQPFLKTQDAVTIATLNYDNTVELAATKAGVEIQTGISERAKSGSFPKVDNGIYLLKLHGSIDWMYQPIPKNPKHPMSHGAHQ